ncbi:MAG: hypothetical protein AAF664_13215, partial [Planctomycetota bacterium]
MMSIKCDPDRILSLLGQEDDPEQTRELEAHLNTCELCQATLRESSASNDWWLETRELLSGWNV